MLALLLSVSGLAPSRKLVQLTPRKGTPLLEWATARGAFVARELSIAPGTTTQPRGLVAAEAIKAGQVLLPCNHVGAS